MLDTLLQDMLFPNDIKYHVFTLKGNTKVVQHWFSKNVSAGPYETFLHVSVE